jgi:hypothetical protein
MKAKYLNQDNNNLVIGPLSKGLYSIRVVAAFEYNSTSTVPDWALGYSLTCGPNSSILKGDDYDVSWRDDIQNIPVFQGISEFVIVSVDDTESEIILSTFVSGTDTETASYGVQLVYTVVEL